MKILFVGTLQKPPWLGAHLTQARQPLTLSSTPPFHSFTTAALGASRPTEMGSRPIGGSRPCLFQYVLDPLFQCRIGWQTLPAVFAVPRYAVSSRVVLITCKFRPSVCTHVVRWALTQRLRMTARTRHPDTTHRQLQAHSCSRFPWACHQKFPSSPPPHTVNSC